MAARLMILGRVERNIRSYSPTPLLPFAATAERLSLVARWLLTGLALAIYLIHPLAGPESALLIAAALVFNLAITLLYWRERHPGLLLLAPVDCALIGGWLLLRGPSSDLYLLYALVLLYLCLAYSWRGAALGCALATTIYWSALLLDGTLHETSLAETALLRGAFLAGATLGGSLFVGYYSRARRLALLTHSHVGDQLRRLRAFERITQSITAQLAPEQLRDLIAREVNGVIPFSQCHLYLRDETASESLFRRVAEPDGIVETVVRPGKGLVGWVAWHERPLLTNDPHDPRRSKAEPSASLLAVPLRYGGRVMAVLALYGPLPGRFSIADQQFMMALAGTAALALENGATQRQLLLQQESISPRRSARQASLTEQLTTEALMALAAAIDAKDDYTRGHSERVAALAGELARQLGCPPAEVEQISAAARMHDIGKIGVPDSILHKRGPLTKDERATVATHPTIGADILGPIHALDSVVPAVRHHHERWDGGGYPDRLEGEQIPFGARILAVADAIDTMITDRPYRRGMDLQAALEELQRHRGSQFDPRIADCALELYSPGGSGRVLREILRPLHVPARIPISKTLEQAMRPEPLSAPEIQQPNA